MLLFLQKTLTGRKTIKGHHMSSGNFNLKPDTITHLLEWPRSEIPPTPDAGDNVRRQKLLFIAGGDAAWYRKQWAVSYTTKHAFTDSTECALCYLSK